MNTTFISPKLVLHTNLESTQNINSSAGDHCITLSNNKVFHNDIPVEAYQKDNALYWEGEKGKGYIQLYFHGLAGHGFLEQNGVKQEVSVQAEDAVYELTYTNGKGKHLVYTFSMGTRKNPQTGGYLLYGKLSLGNTMIIESYQCDENGNIKEGQRDNGFFRTSFDNDHLHADLDLSTRWVVDADMVHDIFGEDFNLWSASFDFSPDYATISGHVFEQKTDKGVTTKGTKYNLSGCQPNIKNQMSAQTPVLSDAQISHFTEALETYGNSILSLTELYTLPAPNMKDANELATRTLYYLAVYYVADMSYNCHGTDIKWSNWFGLTKEKARDQVVDISDQILHLVEGEGAVKKVQDFLIKYAEATLSSSYSSSTDTTITDALSGAKNRLKDHAYCTLPDLCSYYLQGDGETCLSADPGYSIAMEEINKYAYAKLTPGLSKYIEDKNGGWAEKLYHQCLANLQQLRITKLSGSSGSTEISHKTMILNILDGSLHEISDDVEGKGKVTMTYGSAIYAKVFNIQLAELADSLGVEFVSVGSENFVKMMKEIYNILWGELQKETSDYFSKDILEQLQKMQKEYDDITQEEFVQSCIDISIAGMELIGEGKTLASLIPKLASLSEKPFAAYSATICSIVFYATSIASLATVFMNWDKATPAEKAEAILTCIQGVANIAVSAVKIYDIKVLIDPNASFDAKINSALRLKYDGEEMSTIKGLAKAKGGDADFAETIQDIGKQYSMEVIDSTGERMQVSKATKFFRIGEIFVRALNVLLMGFMTVMAAIEIAKEAKEGGYTTTVCLEIVSTSLMAVSFICEAISFVGDIIGMTCSFIPIIGAVAALGGIIFQIVASSLRKPINPLAEFVKDTLVSFLNGLTIPSEQWVKEHKEKDQLLLASI